ncbi:hypothetical protein FA13DRAFT_1710954 [Coprinellus micaceus]|uniref:Uncharacterized protein n=1 Tax=Coprinellus micaceus TaxID=71717 RepID=A0A4Y7T6D3_COPMI|nr:hypothetical protein FA13DRAFT_1710954 [Coprinellus micaceus]
MSSESAQLEGYLSDPNAPASTETLALLALVQADLQRRPNSSHFAKPLEMIAQMLAVLQLVDDGMQDGLLTANPGIGAILGYMKSMRDAEVGPNAWRSRPDDLPQPAPSLPASRVSIPPPTPTTAEPLPLTPPRIPSPLPESVSNPMPPVLLATNAAYAAYTHIMLAPNMELPCLSEEAPPPYEPEGSQLLHRPPPRPLPPVPPQRPQPPAQVVAPKHQSLPQSVPGLFLDQDQDSPSSTSLLQSTPRADASSPATAPTNLHSRSPLGGPRAQLPLPAPTPVRPSQDCQFLDERHNTGFSCPPPASSSSGGLNVNTPSRTSSPTPSSRHHQHDDQILGLTGGASTLRRSRRVLPVSSTRPAAPPPSRSRSRPRNNILIVPCEVVLVEDVATQTGDSNETNGHYGGVSLHEVYEADRPHPGYSEPKSLYSVAVQAPGGALSSPEETSGTEAPAYTGLPFNPDDYLFYPEDRKRRSPELQSPEQGSQSWILRSRNPSPAVSPAPPAPPQPEPSNNTYEPRRGEVVNLADLDFHVAKPSTPRPFARLKQGAQKLAALFRRDRDSDYQWEGDDVPGGVAPRPDFGQGSGAVESTERSATQVTSYLFLVHHNWMHRCFPYVMGGFAKQPLPCCVAAREIREAYDDQDHEDLHESLIRHSDIVQRVLIPMSPRRRRAGRG